MAVSFVKGGRGLATLLLFLYVTEEAGRKYVWDMPWPPAAECNMITNKQECVHPKSDWFFSGFTFLHRLLGATKALLVRIRLLLRIQAVHHVLKTFELALGQFIVFLVSHSVRPSMIDLTLAKMYHSRVGELLHV